MEKKLRLGSTQKVMVLKFELGLPDFNVCCCWHLEREHPKTSPVENKFPSSRN